MDQTCLQDIQLERGICCKFAVFLAVRPRLVNRRLGEWAETLSREWKDRPRVFVRRVILA
jgi:hypothetical protein